MIIGFDANGLLGGKTGIGIYSYNLVQALRVLCEQDLFKFYSYCIFKNKENVGIPEHNLNRIFPTIKAPQFLFYLMWKYIHWPKIETIIGEVDIVHGLASLVPETSKSKKVVTIYDLTLFSHPETHPRLRTKQYARLMDYSVKASDAILAISESTKKDILNFFDIDENKIFVSYCGIDHDLFKPLDESGPIEAVKRKYAISKKYIYYLGTIEPRKNVDVLLTSFSIIKEKTKGEFQLVLSGMVGWLIEDLIKEIEFFAESNDLIFTGYVKNEEAAALYNGAEVFVYPSQYEGFGIPVAEAMACGCPVVTSDSSSLPEVVGEAGLLVEPNNAEALADSILNVLSDNTLKQSLKKMGLQRAQKFNWKNTAKVTKSVYERILE
jgi:glycosyltransferase involved in cell wall biosynthesis